MFTKEQTELILQGISLLLRVAFSAPERLQEVYHKNLCEDTNRWFEEYDTMKGQIKKLQSN
jgi:hypothetical protein